VKQHNADWREKGTVAAVLYCEWKFINPPVVLQQEETKTCPNCKGELYHNSEFRIVVCKPKKITTVREMFKQLLKEE